MIGLLLFLLIFGGFIGIIVWLIERGVDTLDRRANMPRARTRARQQHFETMDRKVQQEQWTQEWEDERQDQ